GIHNDGGFGRASLTISTTRVSDNSAGAGTSFADGLRGGGGIFNDGYLGNATLGINSSSITSNTSLHALNSGFPSNGGGIYNYAVSGVGVAKLVNCMVNKNSTVSSGDGVGGAIYNYGAYLGAATLTVTNAGLSNNSTDGEGGGIKNF